MGILQGKRRHVVAAMVLAGTVAAAALVGFAVSLVQRPLANAPAPRPTSLIALPTPVPRQPLVEFGFSVADDAATGQVVLFGGVDDYQNTWLWNGRAWTLAHPPVSPPGRFDASAAYDPSTGQILLFGGRLEPGQLVNDTWAWTGKTWLEVSLGGTSGPAPGEGSDMAWDATRNQMMLVTATANGASGAKTWTWNGTRWEHEAGGGIGLTYSKILMAYDPVSRSMIAEGCCAPASAASNNRSPTTWRWTGSSWQTLPTSVNPLNGSLVALDPLSGRLILCSCDLNGGLNPELFSWTGSEWQGLSVQPIPVEPEAEVTDAGRHQFLLLGSATLEGGSQLVQTWTLNLPAWRQLDAVPG